MRKRLPLILAIVFGIIAVILVNLYLKEKERKILGKKRPVEYGEVVVAKEKIPKGTIIKKKMLALKKIPVKYIQPRATSLPGKVIGKIAAVAIERGEQVLLSKLTTTSKEKTLSFKTPPGKRAIAIKVDSLSAVGGLIQTGDHVDVIAMIPQRSPAQEKGAVQIVAVPLFQNVLVLTPPSKEGLVTLALSPQETTLLAFLQDQAKIRLVLRAPVDSKLQALIPGSWEALFQYLYPQEASSKESISKEKVPKVEIYRGLEREVRSLE